MQHQYLDYKYKPKDDYVAEYYFEPAKGYTFEEAATNIAGESSIDTWTDILTLRPEISKKLKPHIYSIDKKTKTMKIAYPQGLFENGSIPQILSSLAGNIFSVKLVDNLRLQDITFPKAAVNAFKGPQFGIKGVRKLTGVKKRPFVGTIIKPKVGLSTSQHAKVAREAWEGGCDVVKDDENLSDQKFNPFYKRAEQTLKARDKAESETGEKKLYLCNVTAPTTSEMLRRAVKVKECGGEYIMIDIITTGWTALQSLREATQELGLYIHAHRAMHAAITRYPRHGMSMPLIAKLVRLIGVDNLHVGTVIGKMEGDKAEVLSNRKQCVSPHVEECDKWNLLEQDWGKIKPVMPVASGGLQPAQIPELLKIFGNDVIIQMGGGIHAHPMGTRAGAKAARQAVDATLKGVALKDAPGKELAKALEKWG